MKRFQSIWILLILFNGLSVGTVAAQQDAPPQCGVPAYQTGSMGKIEYVMGGVGADERAVLLEIQNNYNLKLVFAETSGAYVSDVRVRIDHAKGKVIETTVQGPWFIVKLPPGSYKVTATRGGVEKIQNIDVGNRLKSVILNWKA